MRCRYGRSEERRVFRSLVEKNLDAFAEIFLHELRPLLSEEFQLLRIRAAKQVMDEMPVRQIGRASCIPISRGEKSRRVRRDFSPRASPIARRRISASPDSGRETGDG